MFSSLDGRGVLCGVHLTGRSATERRNTRNRASPGGYWLAARRPSKERSLRINLGVYMSCYSQTQTAAEFAARQTFSLRRAVFSGVIGRVRVTCNRRRQRQELIEYLASDHRAANDLGITTYDVRNLFR